MPMEQQGPDIDFYALGKNNQLLLINGKNTSVSKSTVAITGLQSAETIMGIDFRPNTGQLFGVGSTSRLYVINPLTGEARAVGVDAFSPAIDGTSVGFDFNPTVDRIRLVSSSGQNLRLNPETGVVAFTDGSINGAPGASVSAVAYTQSIAGATTTVLYDIDITTDKLYKQNPPNTGTLVEVGSLGVDAEAAGGFDISADSAYALAALTVAGNSGLYIINLSTGAATKAGKFNGEIIGLAIPTQAVAYAVCNTTKLFILDPNTGKISFTKMMTGLQAGENIKGLDMRPATGQLFALGSTSRLYTINIASGAATEIGAGPFATLLDGAAFGFDFNPTVDRIRVVSDNGQNLRLNPITGAVAFVDGMINPSTSKISGSAYTNNFFGATTTMLFDIDAQSDRLVKQDPPNMGTIVDIGPLGIDIDKSNGFDISGMGGKAYGIFTSGSSTKIYSIDLMTGTATVKAGFQEPVNGFTLGIGL
uniref:Gll1766 protein n=1 Tax=uncultured bacterium BLR12 TaxID=506514 RepID=C0INE9_9BACT|nr:Gll1766 protein [uncultured bacterium BLR12]